MRAQEASCCHGQLGQVLEKMPGRVAWAPAACPAGLRGAQHPSPRWDCQPPAAGYEEHLFPHRVLLVHSNSDSKQPWRLGEGSGLMAQSGLRAEATLGGEGHSQAPPLCE